MVGTVSSPCMRRCQEPLSEDLGLFMRGELPRREARAVVRHLLTGCLHCFQRTRRLWTFGALALRDPAGCERAVLQSPWRNRTMTETAAQAELKEIVKI